MYRYFSRKNVFFILFLFVFISSILSSPVIAKSQQEIFSFEEDFGENSNVPRFFHEGAAVKQPNLSKIRRLRFLTTIDYPPFNYLDKEGYIVGYHIDLMRALCQELNIDEKCEIAILPFGSLIPALLRGEGEAVIAGITKEQNNQNLLGFTGRYLSFPGRFVTLKQNQFSHMLPERLKYKKIGLLAQSQHLKVFQNYFPRVPIRLYKDRFSLYEALKKGEIFALFDDGLRASFWLNGPGKSCCSFSDGPYFISQTGLRIAYDKKDDYLGEVFQYALQSLEQKGTLQELYMRYFPISFF